MIEPLGRSMLAKAPVEQRGRTFSVRVLDRGGAEHDDDDAPAVAESAGDGRLKPAAQVKPVFMPSTPG